MGSYQIDKIREDVWAIGDGIVRMFLIDGKDQSVLIDTGCGSGNPDETIRALAAGQVSVINTHSHGDHTAANGQFHRFYMHEADREVIQLSCPPDARIWNVKEGDIISVGDISLEVIEIPGHTPGSIALLDKKRRILFSGDMLASGYPIYMQYQGQDLEQFHQSVLKIINRMSEFDILCPCHGELKVDKTDLLTLEKCCAGILNGTIRAGQTELSGRSFTRSYTCENIVVLH